MSDTSTGKPEYKQVTLQEFNDLLRKAVNILNIDCQHWETRYDLYRMLQSANDIKSLIEAALDELIIKH